MARIFAKRLDIARSSVNGEGDLQQALREIEDLGATPEQIAEIETCLFSNEYDYEAAMAGWYDGIGLDEGVGFDHGLYEVIKEIFRSNPGINV